MALTAALTVGWPAWAQSLSGTEIRDTLFHADGTKAEGVLSISWRSFTADDGSTVPQGAIEVAFIDGVLALSLTPNEGASPDGTSYRVRYTLSGGERFTETWVVPQSAATLTVTAVRVSVPPTPIAVIAQSQVTGLITALQGKADKAAPNIFSATQTIREDAPATPNPLLGLETSDGMAGIYFKLPALIGSTTYTLPSDAGAPNQFLTTDGGGGMFWSSGSGGGAGGTAYEVLQQDGASVAQRTLANFTGGFDVVDNIGQLRTDITPRFGSIANTITEGNDPRLADARAPLAHAGAHAALGSDPITPVSIGALGRNNDFMIGIAQTEPVLKVQGAIAQSAALQEWRDGSGDLAALVTAQGSAFFREMGLSAKTGATVVSQFFQLSGLNRFALSAVDSSLDVIRYDDLGAFKDRPLRILRDGNILAGAAIDVSDATVGAGTIGVTGNYLEFGEVPAPNPPTAARVRLFVDSINGEISIRRASGAVISLEGGGGSSEWTDNGANLSPVNGDLKSVAIGATADLAKLAVVGDDPAQVTSLVRAAGSQSAAPLVVEDANGDDLFRVAADGSIDVAVGRTSGFEWVLGNEGDTAASRIVCHGGDGAANSEKCHARLIGSPDAGSANDVYLSVGDADGELCAGSTEPAIDCPAGDQVVKRAIGAKYLDFAEMSPPASPTSDIARLYAKDDGGATRLCYLDSAGVESCIGGGGGGSSRYHWTWTLVSAAGSGSARIGFQGDVSTADSDPAASLNGDVGNAKFDGLGASEEITLSYHFPSDADPTDLNFSIAGLLDGAPDASGGDVRFELDVGCWATGDTATSSPPSTVQGVGVVTIPASPVATTTHYVSILNLDASSVCAAGEQASILMTRDSANAGDTYADDFGVRTIGLTFSGI